MRRVLFDENMPRLLRRDLPEFEIRTVQEEGWSSLKNGALLLEAQERFDVLLTADKRLESQQKVGSLRIAVVVVAAESARLQHMRLLVPQLKVALTEAKGGTVIVVRPISRN